jgi:hypothetical protein
MSSRVASCQVESCPVMSGILSYRASGQLEPPMDASVAHAQRSYADKLTGLLDMPDKHVARDCLVDEVDLEGGLPVVQGGEVLDDALGAAWPTVCGGMDGQLLDVLALSAMTRSITMSPASKCFV